MYIILSYDISSNKGKKIADICEKNLIRVQKTVFEGEITYKKLNIIKELIARTIDPQSDSVIIYYADTFGGLKKECIGYKPVSDFLFL